MESSRPTPEEFRLDEPEDLISSGASGPSGPDEPRGSWFGLRHTLWSIVAVVAVLLGGVLIVQWTTRPADDAAQESSLSGLEITIPEPSTSGLSPSASPSPRSSASGTPEVSATPSGASSPSGPAAPDAPAPEDAPGPAAPTQTSDPSDPTGDTGSQPSTGPDDEDEPSSRPDDSDARDDRDDRDDQDDDGNDWDGGDDRDDDQGDDRDPESGPGETADPGVNLAASASVQASSAIRGLTAGNVTDGSSYSYWESEPGFPQTLTIDLGRVTTVGRVVLSLPPLNPARRTQTLTVLGSTDGSSYRPLKGSAAYQFRGGADSQTSAVFSPTATRYLQLRFTGANGYSAAQLSDLRAHSS